MGDKGISILSKIKTSLMILILLGGAYFLIIVEENESYIKEKGANYFLGKVTDVINVSSLKSDYAVNKSEPTVNEIDEEVQDEDLIEIIEEEEDENKDIDQFEIEIQENRLGLVSAGEWAGYQIEEVEAGGVSINFSRVMKYGYVYKKIPLTLTEGNLTNAIAMKFENMDLNVESIVFYLRGDQKLLLGEGEKSQKQYYEEKIGEYHVGSSQMVELVLDIGEALENLEGHMDEGISLIMMIDSNPVSLESHERSLIFYEITPINITYANNTIRPFNSTGSYNVSQTENRTLISYDWVSDFENIYASVINYQDICRYFNLELKNINHSVENITINVYGQSGEIAMITADLTKYSKELISLSYDLLEYNNKLGRVSKIELLIDSNPYLSQTNREGNLEIVSMYFSAN